MRLRPRLLVVPLLLGSAAALLLLPDAERAGPTHAHAEAIPSGMTAHVDEVAPVSSPAAARTSAMSAVTNEDVPLLSLHSLPIGRRLSEPRLLVLDPAHEGEQVLLDGSELRLPAGVARTVELRSASPGWVFQPERVVIAADALERFEVEALPRQVIELSVSASDALARARVSLTYEFQNGCCPERRSLPPFEVELQSGVALLEAPPLDRGRFRLEVSTPAHYLAHSPWFELDPRGWSRVALTLSPYDGGTARVRTNVVDERSGQPMAGVRVTLFDDVPEAPLVGLRVEADGLHPQRDGSYDPELLDFPARAVTDADGFATLEVRAPGTYRLAAWNEGYAEFLGDVLELAADQEREVSVRLDRGASLSGHVRFLRDDPALASVLRLGGVRLRREETSYTRALDAQGAFLFQGLAAGKYHLSVDGVVDRDGESESALPLVTRDFELAAGDTRELELALGSLAPGRTLAGSISSGESGGEWNWFVALFPGDAPAESMPLQVARCDAAGNFTLTGVPEGELLVAAMGRSADGRGVAFARTRLAITADDPQQLALELESRGRALQLASSAPESEAREVSLLVESGDALTKRMLEELPPLTVSVDAPARYLGLPEVPLVLRVGEARIAADRDAIVWIP